MTFLFANSGLKMYSGCVLFFVEFVLYKIHSLVKMVYQTESHITTVYVHGIIVLFSVDMLLVCIYTNTYFESQGPVLREFE